MLSMNIGGGRSRAYCPGRCAGFCSGHPLCAVLQSLVRYNLVAGVIPYSNLSICWFPLTCCRLGGLLVAVYAGWVWSANQEKGGTGESATTNLAVWCVAFPGSLFCTGSRAPGVTA